jgi:3-dehydroquinate synthase
MIADNKKTGEALRFVLLDKVGRCYNPEGDFLVTVDQELVKKVVDNFMQRQRQKKSAKTYELA